MTKKISIVHVCNFKDFNYLAHEYCPLFNHRTKDDGGKTAMRSCVMMQNWLPKNTKPLKDASPIKYAWPVAKFTRVRSLLRQTQRSKLCATPALERSSSRFAVYTMCTGCVRGKRTTKSEQVSVHMGSGHWASVMSSSLEIPLIVDAQSWVHVCITYLCAHMWVSGAWREPPYHIFCRETTVTNQILLQDQHVYVCVECN